MRAVVDLISVFTSSNLNQTWISLCISRWLNLFLGDCWFQVKPLTQSSTSHLGPCLKERGHTDVCGASTVMPLSVQHCTYLRVTFEACQARPSRLPSTIKQILPAFFKNGLPFTHLSITHYYKTQLQSRRNYWQWTNSLFLLYFPSMLTILPLKCTYCTYKGTQGYRFLHLSRN